jgi:hypothetical protein
MPFQLKSPPAKPGSVPSVLILAAFALVVGYIVLLVASYFARIWFIDAEGALRPTDFVGVWAAGKLVLAGNAPEVYDWPLHKAIEEAALGHPFDKYFGWHYPPTLLPAAALLALLPYVPAFFVWMAATLPPYLLVIRRIIGRREALLLACAFPAVLWNFSVGQNGFLTAALLGGALATLETRPVLSGMLLGLLSCKPQLGIMLPVLLIAGRYWRVFFAAAVTTIFLAAASWLLFGTATWLAFFEQLDLTNTLVLNGGLAQFSKLQTLIGLVRWSGGSESLAWAIHGTAAAVCGLIAVLIWMRPAVFELKGAAAAAAALTATPYLYVYDLVVLGVPLAFLIRLRLRSGFLPYEIPTVAAVAAVVLLTPAVGVPLAPLALLIVWLMILRRLVSPAARLSPAEAS